jgi:HAD superfamily hydrolase (TIGR01509 family)
MSTQAWQRGEGPSALRGLLTRLRGAEDGQPAALLWDMDGLLVDSEPLWTIAERDLFATWGAAFTPAMKAAMVGTRLDVAVPMMIEFGGAAARGATVEQVSAVVLGRMVELFTADLPLLPGVAALLGEVASAGVPQALVSSSYRVLVDAVLAALPGHPFATSVAGDEVRRGKPDPESYALAARRLQVDPRRSVVLEDTPTGARAGTAVGAHVVYCPSVAGAGEPEPGWRAVATLADVSLPGLRAWLRAS